MEKKKYHLKIKGEDWSVHFIDKENEDALGRTDASAKLIKIYSHKEYCKNIINENWYLIRTLRHELVHAFLYESGLHGQINNAEYDHDEQIVDWFAITYPQYKICADKVEKWVYDGIYWRNNE